MTSVRACGEMHSDIWNAGLSGSPRTIPGYIGGVMFELFLYGLYAVFFCFCVYVLWQNKRMNQWPFMAAAVAIFAIATADIAVTFRLLFDYILNDKEVSCQTARPKYLFYVTNNAIANVIVLYRCYEVWGRWLRIVVIPVLLLLGSSVCGYLFAASTSQLRENMPIYLWLTIAQNVLITVLTGGRICWFAKQTRRILGDRTTRRYYSIMAIILESGAIYSMYVLLDFTVGSFVLDAGLIQVVSIVPTLIIAQIGLNNCALDTETTISLHRARVHDLSVPILDSILMTA